MSKRFSRTLYVFRNLQFGNLQFAILLILSLFLFSYRVWSPAVIFTDELFIEDAAYTMAHGGSWVIPTIAGEPYLAKPPLLYWITAPLYWFFSPQPWVYRIWMVPFGIGTVWVTYLLAKKWYGEKSGFFAGLFVATSIPFVYFTKTGNFDLPNAFFAILTIYFYNLSKKNSRYLILAALSFSLGILNRSFLALTPLIVIAADWIRFHKNRPPFILTSLFLILIFTLPWHILAFNANARAFASEYIGLPLTYHAQGIVPGDTASTPFYYLILFVLFPPTIFALLFMYKKVKPLTSPMLQLLLSTLIPFLILSLSPTRHEWYIVPLVPFLAIMAGNFVGSSLHYSSQPSLKQFLLLIATCTMLLSAPFALLLSPLPQAETVTIGNMLIARTKPTEEIWMWKYPFLPVTRFYPGRKTRVVAEKTIFTPPFVLIARTEDVAAVPLPPHVRTIYKSEQFTALTAP